VVIEPVDTCFLKRQFQNAIETEKDSEPRRVDFGKNRQTAFAQVLTPQGHKFRLSRQAAQQSFKRARHQRRGRRERKADWRWRGCVATKDRSSLVAERISNGRCKLVLTNDRRWARAYVELRRSDYFRASPARPTSLPAYQVRKSGSEASVFRHCRRGDAGSLHRLP
jgi:hypothetical protein